MVHSSSAKQSNQPNYHTPALIAPDISKWIVHLCVCVCFGNNITLNVRRYGNVRKVDVLWVDLERDVNVLRAAARAASL